MNQFLRGRITCLFQDNKIHTTKINAYWTSKIIVFLWQQFGELWKLRNTFASGNDLNQQHQQKLLRLCHDVQSLYAQQELMQPGHTDIFYDDVETHINSNTRYFYLQNWLAQAKPTVKQSIAKVRDNLYKGFSLLTHYFPPLPRQKKKPNLNKTHEMIGYRQSAIPTFFNCHIRHKQVTSTQQLWTPPPWKKRFIQQKLK